MVASHLARQEAICMVTVEATFQDIPSIFIISSQLFDIYPSLEVSLEATELQRQQDHSSRFLYSKVYQDLINS